MSHVLRPISSFCKTGSGGTPSRSELTRYYGGTIPWIKSGELVGKTICQSEEHITDAAVTESSAKIVTPGAILVAMYGATVGRVALLGVTAATNQAVCHIVPDESICDGKYLFHCLRSKLQEFLSRRVGGAQPNISQGIIRSALVPLPPLPEQKRIAAVLDKADALREKRRQTIAKLDTLLQSVFLDMFGDPVTNPKGWQLLPLVHTAKKFCDGPFGSNLKTEHYKEVGVRVVRLQNIGVGTFLDDNKSYISEEHFRSLPNNYCSPGDVLIGTLGDPNLRACILPDFIPRALNKADCVLLKPDELIAKSEYLCWLLNMPSTLHMASSLILGQTRLRISMGRLKTLLVPLPPVELQERFAEVVNKLKAVTKQQEDSANKLNLLFNSLQQRAFKGELFTDHEARHTLHGGD